MTRPKPNLRPFAFFFIFGALAWACASMPSPSVGAGDTTGGAIPSANAGPTAPVSAPVGIAAATCLSATGNSVDCANSTRSAAPFACVRYEADCVAVSVQLEAGGPWWKLDAIDGHTTATLLAGARLGCRDGMRNWRKRFAEDLDKVFEGSCASLGETVTLSLTDADGKKAERAGVAVTDEKRKLAKRCWAAANLCTK